MADIVLAAKFVQPYQQIFSDYIKYLDREQARSKPNEQFHSAFSAFSDYMSNEEKTTGLFDNWNDSLNDSQTDRYKEKFQNAQSDGGNMWQQVISFRPEFLIENKIDINGKIQEDLLKEAARKAINVQLKAENMLGNVVWNGAIHYNTDNIHIHIAFVEKEVTRSRGKLKESSINKAKAAVFASLAPRTKEQELLNQQREELVNAAKMNNDMLAIASSIRIIQNSLPKKGRLQYNSMHITDEFRSLIDSETKYLFKTVLRPEYENYMSSLKDEQEFYKKSYGEGKQGLYQDYAVNKEKDLYARVGNVLLKGAVEMEKIEREQEQKNIKKLKKNKDWENKVNEWLREQRIKYELRKIIEQARRETEKEIEQSDFAILGYSL